MFGSCVGKYFAQHWRKVAYTTMAAAGSVWLYDQLTATSYGTQALEAMAESTGMRLGRDGRVTAAGKDDSGEDCEMPWKDQLASGAGPSSASDATDDDEVLARMQSHFKTTQQAADETLLRWIALVGEQIGDIVPMAQTAAELRAARETPLSKEEKAAAWLRLVRLAVIHGVLGVYAVALLKVLFRTQLNILGRNVYLDLVQAATTGAPCASDVLKHKYLGRCFFFLKVGIRRLALHVEAAVDAVLAPVSLTQPQSVDSIAGLIAAVRRDIELPAAAAGAPSPLAQYLVPTPDEAAADAAKLAALAPPAASPATPDEDPSHPLFAAKLDLLVSELHEHISSPDMVPVFRDCLDVAFARHSALLASNVALRPEPGSSAAPTTASAAKLPFARFIGPLVGVASKVVETEANGAATAINTDLSGVASLERLCALIYSDFDRRALFEVVAPLSPQPAPPSYRATLSSPPSPSRPRTSSGPTAGQ
ncbi:uncharacterized protein AMSG_01046, partial [Thecamonas trahens ATCC 50062]